MYLFTLPFVITGLWLLVRRVKPQAVKPAALEPEEKPLASVGRWMLIAWLIISIFSGLMVNHVNTNRINIIFYPMSILAALGIWHVLFEAVKVRKIAILVAVMYAVSFGGFTAAYFGDHGTMLAKEFCNGFTDAVKYADGLDSDILYITSYSRSEESYACSEIYTLFGADIDARYFQGVAPAYGSDGQELPPYGERYQYVHFEGFDFSQPVGTAYVFNAAESSLFDSEYYETTMFGGFGVAVKISEITYEPEEPAEDSGQAVG
jgi:hypothetical protein